MKKNEIMIGIDICILIDNDSENFQIKKDSKRIHSFFNKVQKQNKDCEIFVCMENTGYYNWPCYEVFYEMQITLFVVNPLHLKKSMGLTRGKNDAIDALIPICVH